MRISDWSSDVCSSDLFEPRLAERDHLRGCIDLREQAAGRLVDAGVGRLRGEHDGDEQRVIVDRFEFGFGVRIVLRQPREERSEEHTSELQSLMRISYAVFCLKKKI